MGEGDADDGPGEGGQGGTVRSGPWDFASRSDASGRAATDDPVWQSPVDRRASDPRVIATLRRRMERDLRAALATGGLILHYQPRIVLASSKIVAAEALLRWPHPRYGLISPATFVPIAVRSNLILAIDAYVLAKACEEAKRWPTLGARPAPGVSVNISARRLSDAVLLDQLAAALGGSGLAPERLEVELVESAVAGADLDALLVLAAIRDLGVGVVLDDFGAEFGSLALLRRLPITAVKLHRSLIRTLAEDAEDAGLVRAAITAAHGLGLTVIAGGVEGEAQRGVLAGLGCDEAQGYLFSHPEPPEAFATRLSFPAGT